MALHGSLAVVAAALLAAVSNAQTPGLAEAERELTRILARPDPRAALGAFLAERKDQDLAHLGYATALQLALGGDVAGAAAELDRFFARYATIQPEAHRQRVAAVCRQTLEAECRKAAPQADRLVTWCERLAALDEDVNAVARSASAAARGADPATVRTAVARGALRSGLPAARQDLLLQALYVWQPLPAARQQAAAATRPAPASRPAGFGFGGVPAGRAATGATPFQAPAASRPAAFAGKTTPAASRPVTVAARPGAAASRAVGLAQSRVAVAASRPAVAVGPVLRAAMPAAAPDAPGAVQVGQKVDMFPVERVLNAPAGFDLTTLRDAGPSRGKIVVLDFFATWNGSSRQGTSELVKLQKELGAEVQVVGVTQLYGRGMDFADPAAALPNGGRTVRGLDADQEVALQETFCKRFALTWPVLVASAQLCRERFGVTSIPTALVLDKSGQLVGKVAGSGAANLRKLRELIGQARDGARR